MGNPDPAGGILADRFVRMPNTSQIAPNSLVAFYVAPAAGIAAPGQLTFRLQAEVGAEFRGFALCAQYIQLTNISAHDIVFNPVMIGAVPSNWTVTTDQSATYGTISIPPNYEPSYSLLAAAGGQYTWPTNPIMLNRIPGASTPNYGVTSVGAPTTGVFPVNYGTYVICMGRRLTRGNGPLRPDRRRRIRITSTAPATTSR